MLSVALVLLIGCGTEPEPAPAEPSTERLVISRIGLALSVPPGYAFRPRGGDFGGAWVVDLNPGGRQARRLLLEPDIPDALDRPVDRDASCPWQGPTAEVLSDSVFIEYYTSVGCGGSGGIEAALVGHVKLGERRYGLGCSTQVEPGFAGGPDPRWCLDLLRSARSVPVTNAPPRFGPTGALQNPLVLLPESSAD